MSFFLKLYQPRIHVYAVYHVDSLDMPLTFTASRREAQEYHRAICFVEYLDAFREWCRAKNISETNIDKKWPFYYKHCLSDAAKAKFIIKKKKFYAYGVAAIFRMFGGCPPLGCSFESSAELQYFENQVAAQMSDLHLPENRTERSQNLEQIDGE